MKILPRIISRLFKSKKSSAIGIGAGAVVFGILEYAGCDVSALNLETLALVAVPILMGLFGVDKTQVKKEVKEEGEANVQSI